MDRGLIVSFSACHWFSQDSLTLFKTHPTSNNYISQAFYSCQSFWFFNIRWVQEIPQGRNQSQVTAVVWDLFARQPCQRTWENSALNHVKEHGMFGSKKSKWFSSRKWPSFDLDKLLVYIMRPNILILSSLQKGWVAILILLSPWLIYGEAL